MTGDATLIDDVIAVVVNVLGIEERAADIGPSTELLDSMPEFDSMAVVELVVALEERFGFEVDDDDITGDIFETVGTLTTFVEGARA